MLAYNSRDQVTITLLEFRCCLHCFKWNTAEGNLLFAHYQTIQACSDPVLEAVENPSLKVKLRILQDEVHCK